MQWLPETIDALTRMLHEAGVVGTVAFLLSLTLAFLLWKHLGQILDVVKSAVFNKITSDTQIISHLQDIALSNSAIMERVGKLPSDKVECRAKSEAEMVDLFKTVLAQGGYNLSDAEVGMVVKHREGMADSKTKEGEE